MRNPTRTTKPERRAARRHSPMISRHLGIAAAARLRRAGTIMNDGDALDRLGHVFAIVADPPPFDLNERISQALEQPRWRRPAPPLDRPAPQRTGTRRCMNH